MCWTCRLREETLTAIRPVTSTGAHGAAADLVNEYAVIGAAVISDMRRRVIRAFYRRFGDTTGWQRASLTDPLAA